MLLCLTLTTPAAAQLIPPFPDTLTITAHTIDVVVTTAAGTESITWAGESPNPLVNWGPAGRLVSVFPDTLDPLELPGLATPQDVLHRGETVTPGTTTISLAWQFDNTYPGEVRVPVLAGFAWSLDGVAASELQPLAVGSHELELVYAFSDSFTRRQLAGVAIDARDFRQVPEPASVWLVVVSAVFIARLRRL